MANTSFVFNNSITINAKDTIDTDQTSYPNIGQLIFNKKNLKFEGYHSGPNSNAGADIFGNSWRPLTQDVASADELGIIRVGPNLNMNPITGILSSVAAGVSRIYQCVITVSPILGAADYQSINQAIVHAIGTPTYSPTPYTNGFLTSNIGGTGVPSAPSPTYPFVIQLGPGQYSESLNQIILPDYVSLRGEDNYNSVITQHIGSNISIQSGSMVTLGQNSEIKNVVIQLADSHTSLYSNALYSYNKSNVVIDNCIITCAETINTSQNMYGIYMDGGEKDTISNNKLIFKSNIVNCNDLTTIYITHSTPKLGNNSIEIVSPLIANIKGIYIDNCIGTESITDKVYIENLTLSNNYSNVTGIDIYKSHVIIQNSYIEASQLGINILNDYVTDQPYIGTITSNVISFTTSEFYNTSINTINSSNISIINFLLENYQKGQYIYVLGSSLNDGIYKISSVPSSNVIILGDGCILANEPKSLANTITLKGLYEIDINNTKVIASTSTISINDFGVTYSIVKLNNVIHEGGGIVHTNGNPYAGGAGLFYTNYKTITVGKINCDFTSLYNAMNSIYDNSYNTRYLIKIQSGIYYENSYIVCLQYVDIEGNGEDNTILQFHQSDNTSGTPNSNTSCFLICSNISIKNLTIKNIEHSNNELNPPPITTTSTSTVLYNNFIRPPPVPPPIQPFNPNNNIIIENVIINSTCAVAYNTGIYLTNASAITLRNVKIIINSTISSSLNRGIHMISSSDCHFYNLSTTINSDNSNTNTSIHLINSECNIYNSTLITNSGQQLNAGIYTENTNNLQKLIQIYSSQIRAYNNVDYSIYADNYYTINCNGVQLLGDTFANYTYCSINCNSCYTFLDENDKTTAQSLNSRGQNEQNYNTITIGDTAGNRYAAGYSTGNDNIFIGVNSGNQVGSASYNTFLGSNTGKVVNVGNNNTLLGSYVGKALRYGNQNTITGSNAAVSLVSGCNNVMSGYNSGFSLTTGNNNVIMGTSSGKTVTSGNLNVCVGEASGYNTKTSNNNTFIGSYSGLSNQYGANNTYLGYDTGNNNIIGNNNVLVGNQAGYTNLTSNIVAVGNNAGYMNDLSIKNTYIGHNSGYNNNTGVCNTYLGHDSGYSNTSVLVASSASYNIAIGNEAGYSMSSATRNVLIGSTKSDLGTSNDAAGWSLKDGTDNIHIGTNSGANATSTINNVLIGSDVGTSITTAGNNVIIGKNTGNAINTIGGNIIIGSASGNDNENGSAFIIGQNAGVGYTGQVAYTLGNSAGKNVQGDYNMFMGHHSGGSTTVKTGTYNLAIGPYSGNYLTSGSRNVMIGSGDSSGSVGRVVSIGSDNTLLGYMAGSVIQQGIGNTLIGSNAGANLTIGANNLILGYNSAYGLSSGDNNVSLGPYSGYMLTSGVANIFSGYQAGYNTTSGSYNINIGYQSGFTSDTSTNNIHIGYQTGYKSTGNNNLFLGAQSGLQNTTGTNNIFIGLNSGQGNNTNNRQIGDSNIFVGTNTGNSNDNGYNNIFLGNQAGKNNTNGSKNIYIGENTGLNSILSQNIFIGTTSLDTVEGVSKGIGYNSQVIGPNTGNKNVFIGHDVGIENTSGNGNIYLGDSAGQNNTTGLQNIYIGTYTGNQATAGSANYNIAIGYYAGYDNESGYENILIGTEAGKFLKESNQIFIGTTAGGSTTTGNNNIFIGYQAGSQVTTQSRNVVIGYNAMYNGTSNSSVIIGNESGTLNNGDDNVFIGNLSGQVNYSGINNTFIGSATGVNNNFGYQNIFMGTASGYINSQGYNNIFMGNESGYNNINGSENICLGFQAGVFNQYGKDNIILGYQSGYYNRSSYNTFIGYHTGVNTDNNVNGHFGENNYNTYIGNLVGQLNNGYNNFFLGYEINDNVSNTSAITNYNNKFAIYNNKDSGITDNTTSNCTILLGGDFLTGTLGIGTLVPDSYINGHISQTDTKLVVLGKILANLYTTFTGSHKVTIDSSITHPQYQLVEGMIMSSTGIVDYQDMNNTVVTVKPSLSVNDKAVYGVYCGYEILNTDTDTENSNVSTTTKTIYYVNSLGEGGILVSNYGGEIQNGDYITTCPITIASDGSTLGGYGSLQSDDILHSYTVAKCTQNIDWSQISDTITYNDVSYKYTMVSCTYHCG